MKKIILGVLLLFVFPIITFAKDVSIQDSTVSIYFSPNGGCTSAIVDEINQAKSDIHVLAYSFTSEEISQALINAKHRGVNVSLVLDRKSNITDKRSKARLCSENNIIIFLDGRHQIMHNKVIIIDSKVVITGSFNFSHNAEVNNGENIIILRDPKIAQEYLANWTVHQSHSE